MWVQKQQLQPCTEQSISSGSRKEFNRAVCHYSVYLIYVLSTLWEIPGWGICKLELRYAGETSTTSDMQMIPLQWQKEIQPVNPKGNQSWIFIGRTDAEAETPILWLPMRRPWCWERLKAGGDGEDKGWDGWMASPTWWTWVWESSGSWW